MSVAQPLAVYTDFAENDVALGRKLLESSGFRVRVLNTKDPREIARRAADADVLCNGYAEVSAKLLARLPNLRLVSLQSMGFDMVDLPAATERGVRVAHVAGAATEEVATHALALMLHQVRGLGHFDRAVSAGDWEAKHVPLPMRLSDAVLGIAGLGRIGRRLAQMAAPLFGQVLGYDPLLPDTDETRLELDRLGVERTSLSDMRSRANVLSLHLPLTDETAGMIDARFLADMPDRAILINVSRGGVVDSAAVLDALASGHLGGAGLDVLETEPPEATHPLLQRDDVIVTPHVAYLSRSTDDDYVRVQAENCVSWLRTGRPTYEVPVL